MEKKIKLSEKQKEVIEDLQNGYILITNAEMKGANVAHIDGTVYHINNRVFWNLVDLKLIFQDSSRQHSYVLTNLGKTIEP
jgi:hypothetical protein